MCGCFLHAKPVCVRVSVCLPVSASVSPRIYKQKGIFIYGLCVHAFECVYVCVPACVCVCAWVLLFVDKLSERKLILVFGAKVFQSLEYGTHYIFCIHIFSA